MDIGPRLNAKLLFALEDFDLSEVLALAARRFGFLRARAIPQVDVLDAFSAFQPHIVFLSVGADRMASAVARAQTENGAPRPVIVGLSSDTSWSRSAESQPAGLDLVLSGRLSRDHLVQAALLALQMGHTFA